MMEKRIEWIDCAKFIAIIAVVTDHCNGFLYANSYIAYVSYYSVSLFVLLAGASTWILFERKKRVSFSDQLKRIKKILTAYAIATFIVLCVTQHRFDLMAYLHFLVSFNIQGPYYYLLFFIQLLIVAPVMVNWCAFVSGKKHKWMIQMGTLGVLGWFGYVSINYTYILPVHGGGKFLGGGLISSCIMRA